MPGVGAAAAGMARLHELGLVDVLREVQQPLLGVCLGMQLLFEHSDEDGGVDCLGLLPGQVIAIPASASARVPHMGWNTLQHRKSDPLTAGIVDTDRAYFVHSYAAPVSDVTLLSTQHGQPWSAAVRSANAGAHNSTQKNPPMWDRASCAIS
ncbi:imidazole glycerol phosphate synthase subunit HisH [Ornithinimicrobium sp. INDO-MA30-4]|uniref:imidazole glycerol phosphate synthase subunit HisH n=1 Tax=Ornithinimicrobium sp. INDO-MA30-4 TaxID=2908651 RepID=UPI001F2D5F86|nr:imidazole glycerol phosphate synthase subunit HisH [Ornithinimicrobium sp. INDO-MA30-4]UJH71148.1 imidazole glycerol phosphate synthase subunit HisH [Ornithinimicrobium sp. INDO-MA30-4]